MFATSRLFIRALVALSLCGVVAAAQPSQAKLQEIDAKVDGLLKQMTLEEKVGQMTQVTLEVVSKPNKQLHALDAAALEKAILRYHVGSILNVYGSGYSVDHWHEILRHMQDLATKRSRLSIPVLYGIDSIHGANYTLGATLFPQGIGLAATWDPELAARVGEVSAFETRASGIPWNFYPVMDLGRNPVWPRFWETYGEDVLLAKTLGTAYSIGMMGDDMSNPVKLAPCLKHYVGYSFPRSGKDRTPAWIDERMMREYFLPTFEAGVKAGVPTVMVNSAEVNGIPGHANYHLLTEVLKQEWGFQGFVCSDWIDIIRLHTRDRLASTPEEAVRMAVMAGVDMSMVPFDFTFYDLLLKLAKEQKVPMTRIDDAVRRILRVKYMVGLFDRPYPDPTLKAGIASKEFTELNRLAARESITLLKNSKGLLPLKKDARVLVTGPTANLLSSLNGGWSITWQGDEEALYPKDKPTILKAIQQKIGTNRVTYLPGASFDATANLNAVTSAAAQADVIVACLGEKAYCETPGNISDLTLDEAQLKLVETLTTSGKTIVLVLTEGRPRIIHRIVNKAQGILMAYLPGMEGGSAIADVLFGDAVPSGKLPFTYPMAPNALVWYDYKAQESAEDDMAACEFPFGFGLSYATFDYSDLKLSNSAYALTDDIKVSVMVKNTGAVTAKEVVQLYVNQHYRSITPPVKELKAFRKIELKPGESRMVEFTVRPSELSFVGLDNKRVVEPGVFTVFIDHLKQDFELK